MTFPSIFKVIGMLLVSNVGKELAEPSRLEFSELNVKDFLYFQKLQDLKKPDII